MCSMAWSTLETVLTAMVRVRNSVLKSASVASWILALLRELRAALLAGSQRSETPLAARAAATPGNEVLSALSWTRRVSRLLHPAG